MTFAALGNADLKPQYSGEVETGFDVNAFSESYVPRAVVLQQEDEGRADHGAASAVARRLDQHACSRTSGRRAIRASSSR